MPWPERTGYQSMIGIVPETALKRGSFGYLFVDPFHGHVVVQQGRVVVVDLVVDLQPVAVEDVGKRYETVAFPAASNRQRPGMAAACPAGPA